jgi:hypothetical protein
MVTELVAISQATDASSSSSKFPQAEFPVIRPSTGRGAPAWTITFVNHVKEFPYFRDEVLPRLERMGLRQKVKF